MAIALASTILIFPQSLNHIILDDIIHKPLKITIDMIKLQDEVLATTDEARWAELSIRSSGLRAGHVEGIQATEGQLGLLQLEVTRGQTSARDLTRLFKKLQEVGARAYGLTTFVVSRLAFSIDIQGSLLCALSIFMSTELMSFRHCWTRLAKLPKT
jgi:hypothetical protein